MQKTFITSSFFVFPIELHFFLKNIHFNNSAGEELSFSENGDLHSGYDILNWIVLPNNTPITNQVGHLKPASATGDRQAILIKDETIVWNDRFNKVRNNCRNKLMMK